MSKCKNPWKTLSSCKMYENPWIKVVENQVINPSGNVGIYGVVDYLMENNLILFNKISSHD